MGVRTYTDEALERAVAGSVSWRGVLRHLGLSATSAAAVRSVRHHADRLALDHGHFTGGRRWSDEQLRDAVACSGSWSQVQERLGLSGGSSTTLLKGHCVRLGLDMSHLGRRLEGNGAAIVNPSPLRGLLPRAGAMLAAAWFTLCGFDVSWPLEPCPYDLAVGRGSDFLRIQVKTTRMRVGGSWVVSLLSGGRRRGPYDPDDLDHFFVVDGDLDYYLIPVAVVAGRQAVNLSAYTRFRLDRTLGADA